MTKSRFFIIATAAFASGVLLQAHFNFPRHAVVVAGSLLIVVLAAAVSLPRRSIAVRLSVWLLVMLAGMGRMILAEVPSEYHDQLNTKLQVDAVVVADVDVRPDKQFLTIRPPDHTQNILVTTRKNDHYVYGDWLWLNGKLTEPKASADFDYKAYLLRWNTFAVMSYPKIIVLKHGQGHWWMRALLGLKAAFVRRINKVLSEVESNLLLGILIGARKGLPEEVVNNFNATGVSHVIAISGYNISILAASLSFLDRHLGRRRNFWLTLSIIGMFVLMSGASASVVRAGLMGALVLLATRTGRLYAITPALCAAAGLMLLHNPRILYWDASFQLSFLATAGVVYIAPVLEQLTEGCPAVFGVKSTLLTTMSAIITTLPFMLYQFGRLSFVAPLVNILILPLVPTTMLCGFLSALPLVGFGFGLLAHWLLQYQLKITAWFAALNFASAEVHFNQITFLGGYLSLIVTYVALRFWLKHKRQPAALPEPDSMIQ